MPQRFWTSWIVPQGRQEQIVAERTITDAEAIEKIAARYETWGQEVIFEDASSLIEFVGDTIEQTGRQAWFEEPGYLAGADDE